MIPAVAKAWIWNEQLSLWVEATFATPPAKYVRTAPVVAHRMDRDFYVVDRDGYKQTGRTGDFIVSDNGFDRVERYGDFAPQHYLIPDDEDAGEAAVVRRTFAAVIEAVLQQRELPLSDDDYQKLSLEAADAIVAVLATM